MTLRPVRALTLPLLLLALIWAIWALWPQADNTGITFLDRAQIALTDAHAPPAEGWTPVRLPDNWRVSRPDYTGYAWYRLPFTLDQVPLQPLAIFIPRVAQTGEVWLNGSLLNSGVRFDTPSQQGAPMTNQPVYLELPSGLFQAGVNHLDIRLQGEAAVRSGLSAVRLADARDLRPVWLQRYIPQVVLPYVQFVLIVGALGFVLAYTLRQRRITLMQIVVLAGVLASASYLLTGLPFSNAEQEAVRLLASAPTHWAMVVVGYRFLGLRVPGFMPLWHAVNAIQVVVALAWLARGGVTDAIWMLTWLYIPFRALLLALVFKRAWRDRSLTLFLIGITGTFYAATLSQSVFMIEDLLSWDSFRWSTFGALPFCVVMLVFFAERFVQDREEAAHAQRSAVVAERGRILQDMHDGMGAQLITALRMSTRPEPDLGQVSRAIEESLQDLRLIIDSLDLTDQDLLPLLGNLRFRLQPRLAALGIRLEWDVTPLPALDALTPTSALAVLRIVQEAINNAVQHAHADCIRLTAHADADAVIVRVTDNGRGLGAATARPGSRGLEGMRQRAQRLGASLDVHSDSHGTQVVLRLPACTAIDALEASGTSVP